MYQTNQLKLPGFNASSRLVLLRMLEKFGIGTRRLCQETHLRAEDVDNLNFELPMEDFEALLLRSLRLSGRPDLLLRYGQEFSLASLGVLGYAFMCCEKLADVLELLIRYHRLLSPECEVRLSMETEQVRLSLNKGLLGRKVKSIDSEIFFSAAVTVFQSLVPVAEGTFSLEFSYPPPAYGDTYRELFGEEITFQSDANCMRFPASLLDEPLQFANPVMKQLYLQQCETLLQRVDHGRFSHRVQQVLLEQPGVFPGIEQAAARLRVGSRTLRRRLAAEHTSYKKLVQQVRCQLAEEYLRESPLSIQEIADMLGYSDVANFRRAFIAWKGISPAQYRRL